MAADLTYQPARVQTRQDGSLDVPTGAIINIESGGALQFAGVDGTAALANLAAKNGAVNTARAIKVATFALAGIVGTTGGGIGKLANPEGATIIIIRLVLDITTKSTGAANASAGVAANGTTSAADLCDTLDVGTAAICADNITNAGAGGKATRKMTSTQFVTVTGSADSTGLVGTGYIEYILP